MIFVIGSGWQSLNASGAPDVLKAYGFNVFPGKYTKDGKSFLNTYEGEDEAINRFNVYDEDMQPVNVIPVGRVARWFRWCPRPVIRCLLRNFRLVRINSTSIPQVSRRECMWLRFLATVPTRKLRRLSSAKSFQNILSYFRVNYWHGSFYFDRSLIYQNSGIE